jgi:hypothetical protein
MPRSFLAVARHVKASSKKLLLARLSEYAEKAMEGRASMSDTNGSNLRP